MSDYPIFRPPVISLALNSMKLEIQHYLKESTLNLNGEMEAAIDKAIDRFDFDGAVIEAASEVIVSEIRKYFTNGDGAAVIATVVGEVLSKNFMQKVEKKT